jgi:hypothetical protein
MNTRFWGPGEWVFLHTVTFNYPEVIEKGNAEHQERKKFTKQLFENLQHTLPCRFCRESFKKFLKRLPIDAHLRSRADLTFWLYRIHNMVNEKLRKQEKRAIEAKYLDLVEDTRSGKKDRSLALKELEDFVLKTMITPEDPQFESVCSKYESQRAGCAKPKNATILASCRTLISSTNSLSDSSD